MTLQLTQSMNGVSAIKVNIHTGWSAGTFSQIFPPAILNSFLNVLCRLHSFPCLD